MTKTAIQIVLCVAHQYTGSAAVLVYDLQDGKLIYGKNADVQRSIASISKVMTAMVILDAELDMREEITLIASDLIGAKQASTRLKLVTA